MESSLSFYQLASGRGKTVIKQFTSTKETIVKDGEKECSEYLEELINQSYYKIVKNVPKVLDIIEVYKDGNFFKKKRHGVRLSFKLEANVEKRSNCCFYGFNYKTVKSGKYVLDTEYLG